MRRAHLRLEQGGVVGGGGDARVLIGAAHGGGCGALGKVLAVQLREGRVASQEQALRALPQRSSALHPQRRQRLLQPLRACACARLLIQALP